MSIFDALFPIPTGGRNADDMGMPGWPIAAPVKPAREYEVITDPAEIERLFAADAEAEELKA